MALQKRIDELDAATQVNSTDMFAVAQSGSNEAVRATTSQIADAVKELNETGALSELTYATSQGKNYLAQVLTNKGVTTQPSETLIQMADKVNALNLENERVSLVGSFPYSFTDYTFNYFPAGWSPSGKYLWFYNNGTMYLCFGTNTLSSVSVAGFIAASEISIPLANYGLANTTPSYVTVSMNGEYIATGNPSGIDVFHIDQTNMTFSWVKSNTGFAYWYTQSSSTNPNAQISNDGNMLIGVGARTQSGIQGSYVHVYNMKNNTYYSVSGPNVYPYTLTYVDTTETHIHVATTGYFMSIPYTFNGDNSLTLGTNTYMTSDAGSNIVKYFGDKKLALRINYNSGTSYSENITTGFMANKTQINIIDMETGFVSEAIRISLKAEQMDVSASTSSNGYSSTPFSMFTCEESNGIYTIRNPLCDTYVEFNRAAKTTSVFNNSASTGFILVYEGWHGTYYPASSNYTQTFERNTIYTIESDDNKIVCLYPMSISTCHWFSGVQSSTTNYFTKITYQKDQLIGYRKFKDSSYETFVRLGIYESNTRAGSYNIATSVTPAVPDEE